jgi:PAS domain S-box-containing protein
LCENTVEFVFFLDLRGWRRLLVTSIMRGKHLRAGGCPAGRESLREVLEFIKKHYREHVTLGAVARAVNFTPAYLTDLTRRETGLSIHRWIVEHRLAEAERLLVNTETPIAAVAHQVGFGNASHFCRQFRRKTGVTPRAWRKTKWRFVAVRTRDVLQSLLDTLPELAWAKDAEGNLLYANKPWYAYTGQTVAESAGWGWLAAVHPEHVSRCLARWSAALVAGTPLEYHVRLRRAADSRYRWYLFRTKLHRWSDGTTRWIGTGTDVHDDVAEITGARNAA